MTNPMSHEDVPEDGFRPEDFSEVATRLRFWVGRGTAHEPDVRAVLSNNFNIILAALDRAKAPAQATELAPDVKGLVERLRDDAHELEKGTLERLVMPEGVRDDLVSKTSIKALSIMEKRIAGDIREAAEALSRLSAPPAEAKPVAWSGSLEALREANIRRQAIWCPDETPDLSFRGNELSGEVGEACNVIKKLERERHNWRGSRDTVEHLAEELADVVICADLCAITAGIDLAGAVVAKFNATSDKVGIDVRLVHPDPRAKAAEPKGEWQHRILGAIDDFASMRPEDDEDWESWYAAAFDLCREKVRAILGAKAAEAVPEGLVLERTAKYFDRKARDLSGDIFATTTTRAEICRTVAAELRALAAALQPLSTGEVK